MNALAILGLRRPLPKPDYERLAARHRRVSFRLLEARASGCLPASIEAWAIEEMEDALRLYEMRLDPSHSFRMLGFCEGALNALIAEKLSRLGVTDV